MYNLLNLFRSYKSVDNVNSIIDDFVNIGADVADNLDLAPNEIDDGINDANDDVNDNVNDDVVADIDIDDFVNIDAAKIDGEVVQNTSGQFVRLAKSSGLAVLSLATASAGMLKDIVNLVYNIGYTTYCVAYTGVKLVVVVYKVVLITGKVLYFTINTTVVVSRMCYRMLTQDTM